MPKDNNRATQRMDLGNYGGQYQLRITNAADLEKAALLDNTCRQHEIQKFLLCMCKLPETKKMQILK